MPELLEAVDHASFHSRVAQLEQGEVARMKDGHAVKRIATEDGRDAFKIGSPSSWRERGEPSFDGELHATAEKAVAAAMESSARSTDPLSVGGATAYRRWSPMRHNGRDVRLKGVTKHGKPLIAGSDARFDDQGTEVEWSALSVVPRALESVQEAWSEAARAEALARRKMLHPDWDWGGNGAKFASLKPGESHRVGNVEVHHASEGKFKVVAHHKKMRDGGPRRATFQSFKVAAKAAADASAQDDHPDSLGGKTKYTTAGAARKGAGLRSPAIPSAQRAPGGRAVEITKLSDTDLEAYRKGLDRRITQNARGTGNPHTARELYAESAKVKAEKARRKKKPVQEADASDSRSLPDPVNKPGKTNWVEKTGGLPDFIKRIAKHLIAKGMNEGRAIATAASQAEKVCATGRTFGGKTEVSAAARARYCNAIRQWKSQAARSRASSGVKEARQPMGLATRQTLAAAAEEELILLGSVLEALDETLQEAVHDDVAILEYLDLPHHRQLIEAWKAPKMDASNRAKPGDSDYGAPGPKPPKVAKAKAAVAGASGDFNSKHSRAPAGTSTGGKFIAKGQTGADVGFVQKTVGAKVDNSFGYNTRTAVIAFQKKHGIVADGVVGHQTALAIGGHYAKARAAKVGALKATDRSVMRSGRDRVTATRKAKKKAGSSRSAGGGLYDRARRSGGGVVVESVVFPSDLQLLEDDAWDPREHPRDVIGRFARKIGGLTAPGQPGATGVRLPDGTRVSKDRDGSYRVVRSGRIVRGIRHPAVAAQDALDRSARSRHPESVGGTTAHSGHEAALPGAATALVGDERHAKVGELTAHLSAAQASGDEYTRRQIPSLERRIRAVRASQPASGGPGDRHPVGAERTQRDSSGAQVRQVRVVGHTSAGQARVVALNGPMRGAEYDLLTSRLDDPNVMAASSPGTHPIVAAAPTPTSPPPEPRMNAPVQTTLTFGGREVNVTVTPVASSGSPPEALHTTEAVALFQTRTGARRHPQPLMFHREAGLPRPASRFEPRIEYGGESYVAVTHSVAMNRPAYLSGFHPDSYAPRAATPAPPSAPERAVTPPNAQARFAALIGTRDANRYLGTPVESAELNRTGSHLFVRGEDGRTWSIDVDDVRRGRINSSSVQVRTQGGTLYSAPGMERLLGHDTDRPTREIGNAVRAHPAPPSSSRVAPGASRSGPSAAIPSAAALTGPGTAPTVLASGDPALASRVQSVVNDLHGFSYGGYTTKIDQATTGGFSGRVIDQNGRSVGSFSRQVKPGGESIYHALFQINKESRASGYGTKVVEKMFETYKVNGFKRVEVTAGLDVGGYQWAKMGFEFQASNKAQAARSTVELGKIRRAVSEGHVPQALADEFIRQLDEGQITSPSQIASWGKRTPWTVQSDDKTYNVWLGKYVLLGSGWSGVKTL